MKIKLLMIICFCVVIFGACNDGGNDGTATTATTIYFDLSKPVVRFIIADDGLLTVQWDVVSDADSYEIWKNTTNDIATAEKYGSDITETSVTITGLTNETTYYIWIKAKNSRGESSDFSQFGVGTPQLHPVFQGLKLTINTGSTNTNFVLPINVGVEDLNLIIDWGDDNIETVTTVPENDGVPHTYQDLNTDYVISLRGSYNLYRFGFGYTFGYGGDSVNKSKVIKAEGNITALKKGLTTTNNANYDYMFSGCTNLTDISGLVFSETTADDRFLYQTFSGCTSLVSLPNNFLSNITTWDVSLSSAFSGCTSLVSLPDNFLSNITTAGGWFPWWDFLWLHKLELH